MVLAAFLAQTVPGHGGLLPDRRRREGPHDRLPGAGRGRGDHRPRARLDREPALRRRREGGHAAAGRRSAAGTAAHRPALRGLRPLRRHDPRHLARPDLGHLRHPELAAGGRSSASPTTFRPSCRTSRASWTWNDDFTKITFELRKGHKWSDGEPFTADDVVFFFEDIIQNKELNPETTKEWGVNPHAKAIDETHVEITLDQPVPGALDLHGDQRVLLLDLPAEALLREDDAEVQSEGQRRGEGRGLRRLDQAVHQLLPEVA